MRAISSMATRHVLADLAGAAASAGFPELHIESVGGVDAARRVADGEPFDLVFLAEDALDALAAAGHTDASTSTPLMRSHVAAAVPLATGERVGPREHVAFPDAMGMRAALQNASRIGYSTGPSGTALIRMIRNWGLTDEVGDRLVQARPGVPVARLLADGEVDLGFQQLSELVGQPGVAVLGILPPDCAIDTVFAGAVATTSTTRVSARGLLTFFASGVVAHVKAAHSFARP
ncbi:substrate-binding domain-containing protein [Microbacterium allomyrinae]|uniref:Substrate-binding domain-containing protein n=1 Tax=Microbacterium allomyrinae TaxID=2830666 RepID=A0A9X1LT02_9MICO|nr:substrate-binding domain-containing protein [Microbacterium allomyrinae]MCC2031262.1 substrate-binding domain-containing protein [Microbacterium allomyrinae]